jgi:hypothetical protein
MKKLLFIGVLAFLASCKTVKYKDCDAYKTHYKPVKAEKHKHHGLCDAYN